MENYDESRTANAVSSCLFKEELYKVNFFWALSISIIKLKFSPLLPLFQCFGDGSNDSISLSRKKKPTNVKNFTAIFCFSSRAVVVLNRTLWAG